MARADTPTLLSLDRFAEIIQIAPPHFGQAAGTDVFPLRPPCGEIYYQHQFQSPDRVSREEIADAIAQSEEEIAEALGYWPAPKWIEAESVRYPQFYRRDTYSWARDIRLMRKSVRTQWGRVVNVGQRAITAVGTATTAGGTLVYSDGDGDGYNETATITLPTALTDACEIKAYFAGESGDPIWEIRPARSVTISGGNVVLVFWAWQLLDPDLWEEFPGTDDLRAIPLEDSASYVTSVDVAREFTDFTEPSAVLYWEPSAGWFGCGVCGGTGCPTCNLTSQNGCLHIKDPITGMVVPDAATYDDDDGQWEAVALTECRSPDRIELYYYAGEQAQRFLASRTCEQLSDQWARVIARMATARLSRPFCSCANVKRMVEELQRNLAFTPAEGGSFFLSDDDLNSPFGTRLGEIEAWRYVRKIKGVKHGLAIV